MRMLKKSDLASVQTLHDALRNFTLKTPKGGTDEQKKAKNMLAFFVENQDCGIPLENLCLQAQVLGIVEQRMKGEYFLTIAPKPKIAEFDSHFFVNGKQASFRIDLVTHLYLGDEYSGQVNEVTHKIDKEALNKAIAKLVLMQIKEDSK